VERASGGPSGSYIVPAGIHKIKHVIIVMQENRSFDTYFGTYPGGGRDPDEERHADRVRTHPEEGAGKAGGCTTGSRRASAASLRPQASDGTSSGCTAPQAGHRRPGASGAERCLS
jgi:hypothetical protein